MADLQEPRTGLTEEKDQPKQLDLSKIKSKTMESIENETDVTALKQKFEDERKHYELNQHKLESQAARLSSMVDEEIERSVQLHKEKTLLQKKLTNLAIRIQVNDLIDVLKETAYIQLQWKELGTVLGVSQSVLEEIATEHSALSITRCHYEVMRYWIVEIGASWEALVSALQSSEIKQDTLAEEIERIYIKSRNKIGSWMSKNQFFILKDNGKLSSSDDIVKYDMFPKVDWKVLGVLLGLPDRNLTVIDYTIDFDDDDEPTFDNRLLSMIDNWIGTGRAYWYTLVDALDGPVLGMTDIAEKIANDKLNQPAQEARAASNRVVPCLYKIDEEEVELQKKKILAQLGEHKGMLKGVVFVFAMTDPKGVYEDMENVRETFRKELKFAVVCAENPHGEYIATFVKATATLNFADHYPTCKTKAFYFAGHGGIDELKRPFFAPQQIGGNQKEVILIRETILSHFQKVRPDQSFLFFFDCCLSSVSEPESDGNSNDEENQSRIIEDAAREFKLEPPFRCVIAYGTSVGSTSIGDTQAGGWFTSSLCKNIKEKIELGEVLALTHKDVAEKSNNQQLPQYRSCVGPIYLKGKPERPIKTKQNESSSNVFKRYRENLFEILSNNQSSITSLATRINISSPWMIDSQMPITLGDMNKDKAAITLLDCLEKAFDNNPEPSMMQDTFNDMEKIPILVGIVQQMRESMKMSKTTVNTNVAEVLKESKEREENFRNEIIDLKSKLEQLQEDYSKMESLAKESIKKPKTKDLDLDDVIETVKKFKEKYMKLENENADLK